MALDSASVLLLAAAKSLGADFSDVMMVGRQWFDPRVKVLARIFATFGIEEDAEAFVQGHKYADAFFCAMGATRVDSLDYNSFEGASQEHDLNLPLPPELSGKYSLVHDGGTLEHIFNFPQALRNCMEMVRPGGYFTQVACGNNLMGHGFWQLSPELIFRALSPENGYRVRAVLLHELRRKHRWVVVTDPAAAQSRVQLVNDMPTYLLTIAERIGDGPIFQTFPHQSDYSVRWEQIKKADRVHQAAPPTPAASPSRARKEPAILKKLRRLLPPPDGLSASYFRQVSEEDVMLGRLNSY